MNDGLPWLKMLLLIGLLASMFVLPLVGIKLHGAYERRRSTRSAEAAEMRE
jgi:hypothetical protein